MIEDAAYSQNLVEGHFTTQLVDGSLPGRPPHGALHDERCRGAIEQRRDGDESKQVDPINVLRMKKGK